MKERATPYPGGWGAPAPARTLGSDGLYPWDPARDESAYWSQPLPITQAQAEHNRVQLARPIRKDPFE
jgi:hypothetical protein